MWTDMKKSSLAYFPTIYAFYFSSLLRLKKKKTSPIVSLRGEAEDTVSCKTYALNIRVIKLVKLKAILENRKRNIYASGSG